MVTLRERRIAKWLWCMRSTVALLPVLFPGIDLTNGYFLLFFCGFFCFVTLLYLERITSSNVPWFRQRIHTKANYRYLFGEWILLNLAIYVGYGTGGGRKEAAHNALVAALATGYRRIDCAPRYSNQSELNIPRALSQIGECNKE